MDIQLAEQRIFALTEKLTAEQARARAMDRRTSVFGGGLGSLLQRPKSEEVELLATQKRFEPFWHAACSLRQVYDRTRKFSVPVTGPEVQSLTLHDTEYPVINRSFSLTAVEHCRDEERQQIFLDGLSGEKIDLAALIDGAKFEVTDLASFTGRESAIIVPPEIRASYVVRQALQPMMNRCRLTSCLRRALPLKRSICTIARSTPLNSAGSPRIRRRWPSSTALLARCATPSRCDRRCPSTSRAMRCLTSVRTRSG